MKGTKHPEFGVKIFFNIRRKKKENKREREREREGDCVELRIKDRK